MLRPNIPKMIWCGLLAIEIGCQPTDSARLQTSDGQHGGGTGSISVATTTEPSPAEKDAVALLRELVANPSLRLSTIEATSPNQFQFQVEMTQPVADHSSAVVGHVGTHVFVIRDGRNVSVLCTSMGGMPYCVMKEGLCVVLDHNQPGGFLIFRGGAPIFLIASETARDGLELDLSYRSDRTEGSITLDLGSLIHSTLNKLQEVSFDAQGRFIIVETKKAVNTVILGDLTSAVPVKTFLTMSRRGDSSVEVLGIGISSPPPFNSNEITENSIRGLGLPIRELKAGDIPSLDLRAPPDLGNDPRERGAAYRLFELLKPIFPSKPGGLERVMRLRTSPLAPIGVLADKD